MTNGRRVEVITSVERRRRWSLEEKHSLMAATLERGGSVSAAAREGNPSRPAVWLAAIPRIIAGRFCAVASRHAVS